MITGNKGEWSEIYVLFKLLADGVLYVGDAHVEKIQDVVYPILKVLRSEKSGQFEYSIQDEIILISGADELRVSVDDFRKQAVILLDHIKGKKKGSFALPDIQEFMEAVNCLTLKAGSTQKTDITLIIHDLKTGQQPVLGFSIKSQLGGASTLLNAGKTTNFIYKVASRILSEEEIEEINNLDGRSKIMDRISAIQNRGGVFHYAGTVNSIFLNNLVLIDSALPQILSAMVLNFFSSQLSLTKDLVTRVEEDNPLCFDLSGKHHFYEYKMKRFLTDVALGMMPSKTWDGQYDATGGYLVVKGNGDLLCYHIYNRNSFEDYLFHNTKFETASSSRHDFGQLYADNGEIFLKLNLQIRFVK